MPTHHTHKLFDSAAPACGGREGGGANLVCPYANATRGNLDLRLHVAT